MSDLVYGERLCDVTDLLETGHGNSVLMTAFYVSTVVMFEAEISDDSGNPAAVSKWKRPFAAHKKTTKLCKVYNYTVCWRIFVID